MLFLSRIFYRFSLQCYYAAILFASLFNEKAKLWVAGRKKKNYPKRNIAAKSIWFHVASLGEYEQARPIIDALQKLYPEKPIVITFFSPSGYEVVKKKNIAHEIYYLPLDTPSNANFIVAYINPELAVFVKYEFWYFTLRELKSKNIPTVLVAAIFRAQQPFFKPHGVFFKEMLHCFNHIFVQEHESLALLNSIQISNTSVGGDTRFDRVLKIAENKQEIPFINEFLNNKKLFVFGSTWAKDEAIAVAFINDVFKEFPNYKFIIAPHVIQLEAIEKLQAQLKPASVYYSNLTFEDAAHYQVLIIDNIGMLSKLYRYAEIAYIGGGFNQGIHNILEAAVNGIPVLFGPKHTKFKEARDLKEIQVAFTINNAYDLEAAFRKITENEPFKTHCDKELAIYFDEHSGGTKKAVNYIGKLLSV
jgi:3-deoxy-D-manno-octulosonic-acid transferase